MPKSYLVTIHNDSVTGTQVMRVLQKLGCFVEMKDLPADEAAQHRVEPTDFTDAQIEEMDAIAESFIDEL